jgi:HD-GYP domain-containing protein (c-di-GMP phosphodiesterase class II)
MGIEATLSPPLASALDPGPAAELDDLAAELRREFGAPVGLLDPRPGVWLHCEGRDPSAFPPAADLAGLPPRVTVRRGREGSGSCWLILPAAGAPGDLLAAVGFAEAGDPARPDDAPTLGPSCPEPALRAWGQAVADRLRAEADSRLAVGDSRRAAREPSVADRLIRRLRVSDAPERFQAMATSAVRHALGVEAVAWIPGGHREPVAVAGGVGTLAPEDYRGLMPDPGAGSIWICNRVGHPLPPAVRRIAVAGADADAPAGWLAAVNTLDGRPFVAEVELLQTVANLVATQRANARLYGDLKDLLFGVIRSLTAAIDAKDPYTSGHSERVARIAVRIGEELGLSTNERGDLYLMGLLHDVGKIGIEDGVLKKPGKLSPEEYRQIQSHVRIGVHILSDLKKLQHLLPGVAHHHEHLDGTGYPAGLAGEQIPLPARILAVADAYDAMSSSRPYRRRMTPAQIEEVFRKGAGVQWDPKVVQAAFACQAELERIRQKGLGESLRQAVGDALGRS